MAKFTKAEMLEEFKEIIYQYARAASFVLEPESGFRLLFGSNPKNQHDLRHFRNPEVDSTSYREPFSIDHYPATISVGQFYDYGIQGIYDVLPADNSGSNEWTFAFGLILDTSKSLLISETLHGEYVHAGKCLYAARAFFARRILDGDERTPLDDHAPPSDMLTIAELAILADLDERTIRNATSKTATNRLDTAVVNSNIYIPREAAIAWLQNKRGFKPTRVGQSISSQTILSNIEFVTASQAGDFVRVNRDRLKFNHAGLAKAAGIDITAADIATLESGRIHVGETALAAIGSALGLSGELFALRMLEVAKKEEIQALRRRILSTAV